MNILKAFTTILLILLLVITALFVDFTYKTFSYHQKEVKADAIVVLAGGKGRVNEGIRLFRAGRAEQLFLIGVDPTVRKFDLYRPAVGDPPAEKVILEKNSRNTLENALYARDLLAEVRVRSIILITSRYHMKRSTLLFRNSLPKDTAIYPYPVDTVNLKADWWSDGGSFQLLFREFYKYCMFRFFFAFAPDELRRGIMSSP